MRLERDLNYYLYEKYLENLRRRVRETTSIQNQKSSAHIEKDKYENSDRC